MLTYETGSVQTCCDSMSAGFAGWSVVCSITHDGYLCVESLMPTLAPAETRFQDLKRMCVDDWVAFEQRGATRDGDGMDWNPEKYTCRAQDQEFSWFH